MKFVTKTAAPSGQPIPVRTMDRSEEMKDALFSAVWCLIQDHPEWKEDLLAKFAESEAEPLAS